MEGKIGLVAPAADPASGLVKIAGDATVARWASERALFTAAALVGAPDVAMLVADTGHRSYPVHELMEYAATTLRQPDGSEDVVRVGVAGGDCGLVSFVTALALASRHAAERDVPVLCVANEVPGRRFATLVRPAA